MPEEDGSLKAAWRFPTWPTSRGRDNWDRSRGKGAGTVGTVQEVKGPGQLGPFKRSRVRTIGTVQEVKGPGQLGPFKR